MLKKPSRNSSPARKDTAPINLLNRVRAKSPSHLVSDASFNYTEKLNAYLDEKRIKARVYDTNQKVEKAYISK